MKEGEKEEKGVRRGAFSLPFDTRSQEKMTTGNGALRTFCQSSRDLASLAEETKKRSKAVMEEKRAAQSVLKELLLSGSDHALVARGWTVSVKGATYRVRPRQVKPVAPRATSSNAEPVLRLWENSDTVREALEKFSGLDPAAALVSYIMEASLGSRNNSAEEKWTVEVAPYRHKGDAEDGPPAPPEGTNVEELVETLLRSRASCLELSNESKEVRQAIQERRDAAAEEVLDHLKALPTEKKVQKINLKDSNGNSEAFYLRIKPPLKPRPKRLSASDYKAALRQAAEDVVKRFCVDSFRLPSTACTREFGENLCETLRDVLALKEKKALEAAMQKEGARQRIALDRVRAERGQAR